jgi:hypothetical protein
MFSSEVRDLLLQVITSWQVWVITVAIIFYISLVGYVAKLNRRRRPSSMPKVKKKKQPKLDTPVSSETDELGLEEKGK